MTEESLKHSKLQQFFSKSNVYQNTSLQQIERQKLTISNDSKIIKDVSHIDNEIKAQLVRPYQTDFDKDMYLMAKPLLQQHLALNIVSKPEINPKVHVIQNISALLHRDLEQAIKRSESLLHEKQMQAIKPGEASDKVFNDRFLNQLRSMNKQGRDVQNQMQSRKTEPLTIKYNTESSLANKKFDKDYDFKSLNKKSLKDHTEFLKLPTSIQDIYKLGITQEDEQQNEETVILQPIRQQQEQLNEKINFESIVSIAGGNLDDQGVSELVKNVQIARKMRTIEQHNSPGQQLIDEDSYLQPVDKQTSARPLLVDQSIQMSIKDPVLPKVQTIINGIRLSKNQFYMGDQEDKHQFKLILKTHLNDLLAVLMVNQPKCNSVNDSINHLLSLKKKELTQPVDGMTRLELLYIFLNEYKAFQAMDTSLNKQQQSKSSNNSTTKTPVKRYMKPTMATTIKKKH